MIYLSQLFRMASIVLNKKWVQPRDLGESYNKVAQSYHRWLELMGPHSRNILEPLQPNDRVLDLACGTGYLESEMLIHAPEGCSITAVDISQGMLDQASQLIQDRRCRFKLDDALKFLEKTKETYSKIYCGWALPYLNPSKALPLMDRCLIPGGTMGFIMNSRTTLGPMEHIFMKAMQQTREPVKKLLNTGFHLPGNMDELIKYLPGAYSLAESETGIEPMIFDQPEDLWHWLMETGALAGVDHLFGGNRLPEKVEQRVIELIKDKCSFGSQYKVEHHYIWGIIKKGDL